MDVYFCPFDEVQADIARDALQYFALLAAPKVEDAKGDGKIIRASKALQRLLGYDNCKSGMPHKVSGLWGSATSKAKTDALQNAVVHRKSFQDELLIYKGDNSTPIICEVSVEPILSDASNSASEVLVYALFIRDVDEIRNRHKRRTHHSDVLHDLDLDHKAQNLVVKDAIKSTMIIEPNASRSFDIGPGGISKGITDLMDYTADDLSGQNMSKLYGVGTSSTDRDMLERALQE